MLTPDCWRWSTKTSNPRDKRPTAVLLTVLERDGATGTEAPVAVNDIGTGAGVLKENGSDTAV